MRDIVEEVGELGGRIVVIGNGTPPMARAFRDERQLPFELLVDPERRAYRAAGFGRAGIGSFSLKLLSGMVRALRAGHRQGRTEGSALQLGGTLLVTPDGDIPFFHASRHPADHADPREIVGTLRCV